MIRWRTNPITMEAANPPITMSVERAIFPV
jgi:hypothetical protein